MHFCAYLSSTAKKNTKLFSSCNINEQRMTRVWLLHNFIASCFTKVHFLGTKTHLYREIDWYCIIFR